MNAIVTTTISKPTNAILKFATLRDWRVYVVGDMGPSHIKESYDAIPNITYLTPEYQQDKFPELSTNIGWNCIQRRNIGYIQAYLDGAEIIASVDDDVIPYDNWGTNLLIGKEIDVESYVAENGVFEPLSVTSANNYWHRGFPLELCHSRLNLTKTTRRIKPLVQIDLWDGSPDMDASCRLVNNNPIVRININQPFTTSSKAIFNSQNTFIHRSVLPYYSVVAHADRMDDIWGGILLQHIAKPDLVYSHASVYHHRNTHCLYKDTQRELANLQITKYLCEDINHLPDKCQSFFELYNKAFN